jgi:polyphosphate kinase
MNKIHKHGMELNLSVEDVKLLNTKEGYRNLLKPKKLDIKRTFRRVKYEYKLKELQAEMIKMQSWLYNNKKRLVIIMEGRDAAGKGGAIRRMSEHLNPRKMNIVALPKPDAVEAGQWYFQRYVNVLPRPGEIVFFNRSWYNRAVVEPVNGFCTKRQYENFMKEVSLFEDLICSDGLQIIKYYFSISKDEQARRFDLVLKDPLKKWKMSPVDLKAQELWDEYTKYKDRMLNETSTEKNPWIVIPANRKTEARIQSIEYVLDHVNYK